MRPDIFSAVVGLTVPVSRDVARLHLFDSR